MQVVLRVDASLEIGVGHVMRCLTLADELRSRGAVCHFVCRAQPGDLIKLLQSYGFDVTELPFGALSGNTIETDEGELPPHARWLGCDWRTDARQTQEVVSVIRPDWLIVDHYALDERWEARLEPYARGVMVIDDLADRPHVCRLLLDQNFYADMKVRYLGRIPSSCEVLLGPDYVLLRSEFIEARQQVRSRHGRVSRILVFFGGSDPQNQTSYVLQALKVLDLQDVAVDVVIGITNPHRGQIEQICGDMPNVTLHCQVSNMAELIMRADLGIGAGGVAMWERCYLGLPTITVVFADNQLRTTEDLAKIGAIKYLGRCDSFTANDYEKAIKEMIDSPEAMRQMTERSLKLVRPGAQRVADTMERISRSYGLLM